MGKLEDKVAIITGAASGIGAAAATAFAAEGAAVAVLDIDAGGGQATANAVHEAGGEARFFSCDVTSSDAVGETIRAVKGEFGQIDILYNNAGGNQDSGRGGILEVDLEHWWDSLKLDLFGTMLCCRHAIPHLLDAGNSAIVNTSSGVALKPTTGRTSYGVAKGGIGVLTRELAAQFGPQGLRVNAIAPGYTRTPRVERNDPMADAKIAQSHLLGALDPADIAAAALFLASDDARHITGVILPVDSGYAL